MVTIIDYGLGNLGSVQNMFKKIGIPCEVTSNINKIQSATKVLLPGVGAFDAAMAKINNLGLKPILRQKALEEKIPFLGICLGMQLLVDGSEEGEKEGLGLIPGFAHKFNFANSSNAHLRVPHMGWNIASEIKDTALTSNMFFEEQRFYFCHSYYVLTKDPISAMGTTTHGNSFHSMIHNDNIYGTQFHPEKSHRFGMNLFSNFAAL